MPFFGRTDPSEQVTGQTDERSSTPARGGRWIDGDGGLPVFVLTERVPRDSVATPRLEQAHHVHHAKE